MKLVEIGKSSEGRTQYIAIVSTPENLANLDRYQEIARRLDLAESTVKIHVQNIFKKLNMTSRVQVALYAVEHGFG